MGHGPLFGREIHDEVINSVLAAATLHSTVPKILFVFDGFGKKNVGFPSLVRVCMQTA